MAGCDSNDGAAEEAGETVDEAVEEADKVAKETRGEVEEATD